MEASRRRDLPRHQTLHLFSALLGEMIRPRLPDGGIVMHERALDQKNEVAAFQQRIQMAGDGPMLSCCGWVMLSQESQHGARCGAVNAAPAVRCSTDERPRIAPGCIVGFGIILIRNAQHISCVVPQEIRGDIDSTA